MSTDDGAVDKQMLHVWVIDEMLMQLFPDFVIAPSRKPFIDAVPVAVRFWQQSPLGTAAGDPEHAFDKAATLGFLPNVDARTGAQEAHDL